MAKRRRADGWSYAENRFLRSYAGRVIRGRYHSALEAAVACRRRLVEYGRHRGSARAPRTVEAVRRAMRPYLRSLGRGWPHKWWSKQETQIAERYVGALLRHQYRNLADAAADCKRELDRLHATSRAHADKPARPLQGIVHKLKTRVHAVCPEWKAYYWTPAEDRVLQRYAAAVVAGRYPDLNARGN